MQAMVLRRHGAPLEWTQLPDAPPAAGAVRIRVTACGVCRTDLHVVDGELAFGGVPIIPGHEIVGRIEVLGDGVTGLSAGMRVGVSWLGASCGVCPYCTAHRENLCDRPTFTGCSRDGGYASHVTADARFVFPLGETGEDAALAPLMCAGMIGWRALLAAGDGLRLGLYGFGAAAHIAAQVAHAMGRETYAFTRPGDTASQDFARTLGVAWADGSDVLPPQQLDAAILFAPVGALVPQALRAVRKGGRVVCAGIHMSDIPSFPYSLLWEERAIVSVANLTRQDGHDFLRFVQRFPVRTHINRYPLDQANQALDDLRQGRFDGAAVLCP